MGQSTKISILQGFTANSPKDAASYLHLPGSTVPNKRVHQPANGSFRSTERVADSRKQYSRGIYQIYFASFETCDVDTGSDTNLAYIYAENGIVIEIDAGRGGEVGYLANVA